MDIALQASGSSESFLPILLIALTLGIASSFSHCLLMCGPLNAYLGKIGGSSSISANGSGISRSSLINLLLLHSFRVLSYGLIGALLASLSFLSFSLIQSVPFKEYTTPFLAISMIFIAVINLLMPHLFRINLLDNLLSLTMHKLQGIHPRTIMISVGLLYGLIPCGMSYTAYLTAASYAGIYATNIGEAYLIGAGFAGSFAIGTTVSLIIFGLMGGALNYSLFHKFRFLAPALLILTGLYLLKGVLF